MSSDDYGEGGNRGQLETFPLAVVALVLVGVLVVGIGLPMLEDADDEPAEPDCTVVYIVNDTDGREVQTTEPEIEDCEVVSGDDVNMTWHTPTDR